VVTGERLAQRPQQRDRAGDARLAVEVGVATTGGADFVPRTGPFTRNNPAATVLTEGPNRCWSNWYDVTSAPPKYRGRNTMLTTMRPMT